MNGLLPGIIFYDIEGRSGLYESSTLYTVRLMSEPVESVMRQWISMPSHVELEVTESSGEVWPFQTLQADAPFFL